MIDLEVGAQEVDAVPQPGWDSWDLDEEVDAAVPSLAWCPGWGGILGRILSGILGRLLVAILGRILGGILGLLLGAILGRILDGHRLGNAGHGQ